MNKFEIKSPIFRHSDFKIIGNKINICQSKDYYFNNSKYLKKSISEIRKYTSLPIVAGFGIKNKNHVKEICKVADGAVVGSSIVKIIEENVNDTNKMISLIDNFSKDLKSGTFL